MENVNLTDTTTAVSHGPDHTMDLMPEAANRPELVGGGARNPVQDNRP